MSDDKEKSNIIEHNFRKEGESFKVNFGMLEMKRDDGIIMWVPCIRVEDGEFRMQLSAENGYFDNSHACQAFLENLSEAIKEGVPTGLMR